MERFSDGITNEETKLEDRDNKKMVKYDGVNFRLKSLELGRIQDLRIHLPKIREMTVYDDDIFICSFPKSGTHWMWEILKMMIKEREEWNTGLMRESVLEFTPFEQLVTHKRPRIFCTHLPARHLPKLVTNNGAKVIFIQRNPKDTLVSWYHHSRRVPENTSCEIKWEEFFNTFLEENSNYTGPYQSWFQYMLDWQSYISDTTRQVHMMYYEDLKKDCVSELKKLTTFLKINVDEILLLEIAEKCEFQNMKSMYAERKVKNKNLMAFGFQLRKGEVGDWKTMFTVAQNERFDKVFQQRMGSCEFSYTFD